MWNSYTLAEELFSYVLMSALMAFAFLLLLWSLDSFFVLGLFEGRNRRAEKSGRSVLYRFLNSFEAETEITLLDEDSNVLYQGQLKDLDIKSKYLSFYVYNVTVDNNTISIEIKE